MDRRRFLTLAAAAPVAALAACAKGEFGDPELMHMVEVTPANDKRMVGVWKGTFTPARPGRGEGGEAVLDVKSVEGTLMRSHMSWYRDGKLWREQDIVSALALGGGHWNFMSTHAMVHRKGEKSWITADIILPDGNLYKHNLSRTDVDWTAPMAG